MGQEAAMNPITGRHLDHQGESKLCKQEKDDVVTKANRGQDRALAVGTQFDVINFQSKREGLDPPPSDNQPEVIKTYIPDSRVPYNIVSTLSHKDHRWAPPDQRPQEKVVDPKTRFASKFIGRQTYNVGTNKFLDKHEEKVEAEKQEARHTAVKAFWKTHNYDPLTIKYYDESKEDEYWRQHHESEKTQGQSIAENIRRNAPTAHLAEGNLYDPITCQPKNEDAITQLHRLEQGKAEFTQGVLQRVGNYLQNEDDFQLVQDDRALNRTKWKKFEDDHSHGFDIVNNVPHFGRGAAHKNLPKARPDATMWEQINEAALDSIDAQPLGDISQGASVEHADRELVNPDVPPLRTRPFTHSECSQTPKPTPTPQSLRSQARSQAGSAQGVNVTKAKFGDQSRQSTGRLSNATGRRSQASVGSARLSETRRSGSVSASGRIRTGGFQ